MKIAVFDIETAGAETLHTFGEGFFRLGAVRFVGESPTLITTDPYELIQSLDEADAITGHNILNFDLLALAKWYGADYETLCRKSFDTFIVERHLNPVAAKGAQLRGYYGLDATAERYGVGGKSFVDFDGKREIIRRIKGDKAADKLKQGTTLRFGVLKLLAELYGGFHLIPQEDQDYREYLVKDVDASEGLFLAQRKALGALPVEEQQYTRREHLVTAALGRSVTLEGFRVDVDETMKRWSAGQARLEAGKQMLHERYGMPLEGRYPHRSNAGKVAFRMALLDCEISADSLGRNWPVGADGSLLTNKDVLNRMVEIFDRTRPVAADLCRTVLAMNGERTVYGTMLDHLVGDRVHPYIGSDQSSGRWSMRNPGLTVMGKRGGKAVERSLLLADNDEDVLVAIDGSQIDARMIGALSQDPEYMKLFEPGRDLHSEVAWRIWSNPSEHGPDCVREPVALCRCERRTDAKVGGHGWNYGMGINAMVRQLGLSEEVARRFDGGMHEAFPRLVEWKGEVRAAAGALGFDEVAPEGDTYRILYTAFGRPVRVERDRAYTQAPALLGQGSTRDAMAEAMLRLAPLDRRRIRAVIHDEFVFSIPRAGADEKAAQLAQTMSFTLRGVDITFDTSRTSHNLGGCYGEQYESMSG